MFLYYNQEMLDLIARFSHGDEWNGRKVRGLLGAMRWNQYITNWPVVLDALRKLWEMGKVSELKTPFYEPFEKPANK
jgi:hypothetical protein